MFVDHNWVISNILSKSLRIQILTNPTQQIYLLLHKTLYISTPFPLIDTFKGG